MDEPAEGTGCALPEAIEEDARSTDELRATLRSLGGIPVLRMDRDGRILAYLTGSGTNGQSGLHDLPAERLVGRSLTEFVPPEERESFLEVIHDAFDCGTPAVIEQTLEFLTGDYTDAIHIAPFFDHKERVVSVVAVLWDITQRRARGKARTGTREL